MTSVMRARVAMVNGSWPFPLAARPFPLAWLLPLEVTGATAGELTEAGYVIAAQIPANYGPKKRGEARIVYEINAETAITCRDTAVLMLALIQFRKDTEGMVHLKKFADFLFSKQNRRFKLMYLRKGRLEEYTFQS